MANEKLRCCDAHDDDGLYQLHHGEGNLIEDLEAAPAIEQQRDQVKLTVTHDDFAENSKVFPTISNGWPLVLSSLKSYLEANRVLWAPWYDKDYKKEARAS